MTSVVSNIENNTPNPLEDLGALTWVRSLSYRVPGAAVILVGTKCDLVEDLHGEPAGARMTWAAAKVERHIRSWVLKWTTQRSESHQPLSVTVEKGISLVNCGLSRDQTNEGWPCDVSQPSLLHRIAFSDGKARKAEAELPLSWDYALNLLDEVARDIR